MAPRHWPKGFIYSRESVAPDMNILFLRLLLSTGNAKDLKKVSEVIEQKQVYPHLKIQTITKKPGLGRSHPLANLKTQKGHAQRGVFATKTIPEGTELGEYVGEIALMDSEEYLKEYLAKNPLSEYAWVGRIGNYYYFVDPHRVANELAFINDYRALQSKPNVKTQWMIHRGCYYFGYVVARMIEEGEELLVDYGENYGFFCSTDYTTTG